MSRGEGRVTADGCPVDVYRLLPALGEAELIDGVLRPGSSVLDLGAGTGRIADALAARGHAVVAVDNSPEMLAEIRYAEPVLAGIETFRDERKFDAVVLASHLINTPNAGTRQAFLATVASHLRPGATAFVEWHPPEWFDALTAGATYEGAVGVVDTALHVHSLADDFLDATVRYAADGRAWTQPFTARRLPRDDLEHALHRAGLVLVTDRSYRGDWVLATSVDG